jgi:hypothetical protein
MTLFDALLLVGNGVGAGAFLSRFGNPFFAAIGLFNAFAIVVSLVARFA